MCHACTRKHGAPLVLSVFSNPSPTHSLISTAAPRSPDFEPSWTIQLASFMSSQAHVQPTQCFIACCEGHCDPCHYKTGGGENFPMAVWNILHLNHVLDFSRTHSTHWAFFLEGVGVRLCLSAKSTARVPAAVPRRLAVAVMGSTRLEIACKNIKPHNSKICDISSTRLSVPLWFV